MAATTEEENGGRTSVVSYGKEAWWGMRETQVD